MNKEMHEQDATESAAVEIPAGPARLKGYLHVGEDRRGAILFAHGSGSSRRSPRNQLVARKLQEAGFATLLFDLLTEEEELLDQTPAQLRLDIDLLSSRLDLATTWLSQQRGFDQVRLGYFGASTGAAAALRAAAERSDIAAVVSRGGRPDLTGPALARVRAAVLLIVGSEDRQVLELNRETLTGLKGEKKLEVIVGATHLFEEPGTLENAAEAARRWFEQWLVPQNPGIVRAA